LSSALPIWLNDSNCAAASSAGDVKSKPPRAVANGDEWLSAGCDVAHLISNTQRNR
jgi:hypothetical protein